MSKNEKIYDNLLTPSIEKVKYFCLRFSDIE